MSLLSSAVITGSLAIVNGNQVFDNPQEAALQHLSRAAYIELEIDKTVDKVVGRIDKKIPQTLKTYGPYAIVLGRVVAERQVSYRWTF